MICKIKCILALVAVLISSAVMVAAQRPGMITGRVVDADGKAISSASVSLEFPKIDCGNCDDQIFPGYTTEADGKFYIHSTIPINTDTELLIIPPVPEGTWTPLNFANADLRQFPEFRGSRLPASKTGSFELGDVKPSVVFVPVTIDLSQMFGSNKSIGNGSPVSFDIYYRGTKIAEDFPLNANTIDPNSGKTRLALTPRKWRLVFKVRSKTGLEIREKIVNLVGLTEEAE